MSRSPAEVAGEHGLELLDGEGVGHPGLVGRDGEGHAHHLPVRVDQRAPGVARRQLGRQHQHLAAGAVAVVDVGAGGGDLVADLERADLQRPAARVAEHPAGVAVLATRTGSGARSLSSVLQDGQVPLAGRTPRPRRRGSAPSDSSTSVPSSPATTWALVTTRSSSTTEAAAVLDAPARQALDLHRGLADPARPSPPTARWPRAAARGRAPAGGRRTPGGTGRRRRAAQRLRVSGGLGKRSATAWAIEDVRACRPSSPARGRGSAAGATGPPPRPPRRRGPPPPGRSAARSRAAARPAGWSPAAGRPPGRGSASRQQVATATMVLVVSLASWIRGSSCGSTHGAGDDAEGQPQPRRRPGEEPQAVAARRPR